MDDAKQLLYFRLFNEIGIIQQISTAFLEARLPDGLIAPHFNVLNHLIRVSDGRTPLEMARAFQVPKTTLTHTLAGLEERGLIEMRPNPDDGRSKRVWLTDKGCATRNQAIAGLDDLFEMIAAEFPSETVEEMLPELERLRIFIDALRERVT
jgi:DNA-binding MarR family transcriptional regulator